MRLLLGVRSAATAPLALVAVGAMAVAKAFYSPAATAALPNVVDADDLAAANAVSGSAWGTMTVVGASLGGVVSGAFGPDASFAITVACLLIAATLTTLIRRPLQAARADVAAQRAWPALVEALRYLGAHPRIRALVTVKSAAGLGNGVLTIFPLLAALYGAGAVGTGLLFALRGAGALVGPLLMRPVLGHRSWVLPGLAISMSVYGLAYVGAAFSPWFPLVLALVFVAHFGGGTNWALSNFALQGEVPDHLRGRIFATDMMLAHTGHRDQPARSRRRRRTGGRAGILAVCGLITLTYAVGWRIATPPAHAGRAVRRAGRGRSRLDRQMGLTFATDPASVRTPATSANLGPGFDALGLALERYDDLNAADHRRRLHGGGDRDGAGELPTDAEHRWRARCWRPSTSWANGRRASPWVRRTGSAGARARLLVGGHRGRHPAGARPGQGRHGGAGRRRGAALAAALEGHPDNVRRACCGGFTIAWTGAGTRAVRAWGSGVRPTVFVPAGTWLTATARSALPPPSARRRRVQRRPGRAARACADRAPSCCSRPPRTGCTRATGPTPCRARHAVASLRSSRRRRGGQRRGPQRARIVRGPGRLPSDRGRRGRRRGTTRMRMRFGEPLEFARMLARRAELDHHPPSDLSRGVIIEGPARPIEVMHSQRWTAPRPPRTHPQWTCPGGRPSALRVNAIAGVFTYHEHLQATGRLGGDMATIRRVAQHNRMKKAFDTTPSDAALRAEDGWVDMDVRWLLTRETVGAAFRVRHHSVPPGSKHDIHRHPNAEEFEYLVSGRDARG